MQDTTATPPRTAPDAKGKIVHAFGAMADRGAENANKASFHDPIRTSLHLLLGSLGIMRGGVARFSRFEGELTMSAMRGLGDAFPLSLPAGRDDERLMTQMGTSALLLREAGDLPMVRRFGWMLTASRIEVIVPLVVREELLGMVFAGEKASGEPYTPHEREIVCAMSRHIGVAIAQRNLLTELERKADENRKLYDDMRATYKDTVKAFAAAIDSKDKYTEGHSVRVGKYTEIIAKELGWKDEEVEGAAVSGYLHDVGKLTVDRRIINAPYRIDAKESTELNRHPSVGYEILLPIHHPYADVPLAAKYHHERLDGRGYPDGLHDREIPYIAKMVNLADSFDAMTTDRPYKRRRKVHEVFEDLRRNTGSQFSPEITSALFRGMLREATGEAPDRRFRRLLGRDYMDTEGLVGMLRESLDAVGTYRPITLASID